MDNIRAFKEKCRRLQSCFREEIQEPMGFGPWKTSAKEQISMIANGENTGRNFVNGFTFEYAKQRIAGKKKNETMAMAAKQMGTVVTVLVISDGNAYLTWLGDSRIYMYRDGHEVYRTEDHSIVNEMAKIKTLSASSYEKYASIVTKSIMGNTPVDIAPIRKIEIEEGDVFILCTDGFHKEIDMTKALNYNDSKRDELDALASDITDNYSFVKVVI